MKTKVLLLLLFCVALTTNLAMADSVLDPVIKVGSGGGSGDIIVPNFLITSPTGTSPGTSPCILTQLGQSEPEPDCIFANHIFPKASIFQLTFDINNVDFSTVNCSALVGGPFSQCSVTGNSTFTQIVFFNGSVPHDGEFSLDVEGFPANSTFNVTAGVPEPGTLSLLLGGIGALLARRRRTKR